MDLINLCFSSANVFPTLLMIGVVIYWLLMIIGVVGVDMFDIDVEVDTDLGVGADLGLDGDLDGDLASGGSTTGNDTVFRDVFEFFYLNDVPLMVIASAFVLGFWTSSIMTSRYFNPDQTFLISLFWLIPNMLVGLVFMRIVVTPMAMLFRRVPEDRSRKDLIGLVGRVSSRVVNDKYGEIQVVKTPGEPELVLNVRAVPGDSLGKGDAAKIIEYNLEDGTFLVELTKWENTSDE